MKFTSNFLLVLIILTCIACNQNQTSNNPKEEVRKQIEMKTDFGTMVIELYDETPLHRDNFVNLVKHGAYDSLLFHRVIKEFMIQGGDPDSKNAKESDTLGEGDAPYVVKAEFSNNLFHKKGVLAAARDNRPDRASSGMQFYIVQGKMFNDSLLDKVEGYINKNNAVDFFKRQFKRKPLINAIDTAILNRNMDNYRLLRDSILNLAKNEENFMLHTIPEHQREVYRTVGGTPHLDQNYTVFGEVIKGLSVLDSIASVKTNDSDRPLVDVRILSVNLVE